MGKINVTTASKDDVRGGTGHVDFEYLLTSKEMGRSAGLFARITVAVNSSIGYHEHQGDNETYFIVQGSGQYNDNGTMYHVNAGDSLFVNDGEGHGLVNTGDIPLVLIALILNG